MLQTYVSIVANISEVVVSVSYRCCKSRKGYCICFSGYTRILQAFVSNVSSVFFRRMLQVFLFGCCVCFTHMFASVFVRMLHMFCNDFLSVLAVFASVSDACFECFIFLQTHVAKVSSGCLKSRLDVVRVAM
jgi:hypothetical protein